jgi:hypothetical protein
MVIDDHHPDLIWITHRNPFSSMKDPGRQQNSSKPQTVDKLSRATGFLLSG